MTGIWVPGWTPVAMILGVLVALVVIWFLVKKAMAEVKTYVDPEILEMDRARERRERGGRAG